VIFPLLIDKISFEMKYILILTLLLFCHFSQSQKLPSNKMISYFGVHFRPIFPSDFIGAKTNTKTFEGFTSTIIQTPGHNFGATIRLGVTKLISIETGLNYTHRNFNLEMSLPDSNLFNTNDLSFISYDIPINGLIYVQLGQQVYMNASLGLAASFAASGVTKKTVTGTDNYFSHNGYVNSKLSFDMNANYGFEFRTKNSGFFYFGGSARVPFKPILLMAVTMVPKDLTKRINIYQDIDGSYLGLDFKYFFPIIENKGVQPLQGPIE
jgi:hypothetical protein